MPLEIHKRLLSSEEIRLECVKVAAHVISSDPNLRLSHSQAGLARMVNLFADQLVAYVRDGEVKRDGH
jgi:hypothetical protein